MLLPAAITIDPAQGLLVLPHYDGDDLAARWHESDGGAMLGPGLAAAIPALLADLARIDPACVTTDPVLSNVPGLIFGHTAALASSASIAANLPGLACSPASSVPRPSSCWPTGSTRP